MSDEPQFIAREGLCKRLQREMSTHKVLYIGCHIGWGKTTAVRSWLERQQADYGYASAESDDFFELIEQPEIEDRKLIVLDDLFLISDEAMHEKIVDYVASSPSRFVLISRTELPAYLKPFYMTKQMVCFDRNDFRFSIDEMLELLSQNGITVSEKDAEQMHRQCFGHPLALTFYIRYLKSEPYSQTVYEKAKRDVFECFDYALFQRWECELQTFLMDISILESFGIKLAEMVSGRHDTEQCLRRTLALGSFLKFSPPDCYEFDFPIFREYLRLKQGQLQSSDHILQLYQNAGLYCELENDTAGALKYYSLAGNSDKISTLLADNSRHHPGNAQFYDTERYYLALSEEQILKSPELMCGMSMIYSLRCDPEESERWYSRLESFAQTVDKKDSRYKLAREKLLYLNITLPHRGSAGLGDILSSAAAMCVGDKLTLQEISVTGNCPSLLNGGKDFCEWTKNDRKLYHILRRPLELVMGRCAVGLADTALGESLFNKCTDLHFSECMVYLNNGLSSAMLKGTLQMQFAAVGVMGQVFIAQDGLDTAQELVTNLLNRVQNSSDTLLMPNIKATLAQYKMLQGDTAAVDDWLKNEAPDELASFHILSRHRYLIKVRAYIINERYLEALSLLDRLQIYYERYERPFGQMISLLLSAIVMYRMKDECWRQTLGEMLHRCEQYGFTRIVADEGIAALSLLNHFEYDGDAGYYNTLLSLCRSQAVMYPQYMQPKKKATRELTQVERSVLKLMVQGMTNDEIAEVLGVTARTVKFHLTNIYAKLNVKNRTAAIKVATENALLHKYGES